MRIITGIYKGRHFDIPKTFKARPTTDFAKENIFNVLPYALPELPTLPRLILERRLLKPGGVFVFEHGKHNSFEDVPGFVEHRAYGSVNFSIFRPQEEPQAVADEERH